MYLINKFCIKTHTSKEKKVNRKTTMLRKISVLLVMLQATKDITVNPKGSMPPPIHKIIKLAQEQK